jgi:WD40 repeat protein
VVSVSWDETFRVWDVKNGETILEPINAGEYMDGVCYSPDGKMIATGGKRLKIWDADTSKLLKTLQVRVWCLAWTSDGKTLITGGSGDRHEDRRTVLDQGRNTGMQVCGIEGP